MFILLEDSAEIRTAQSELEATISRQFPGREVRNIGGRRGAQPGAMLHTDGRYWYWSADHSDEDQAANPKRFNWFGRIGSGQSVPIAVEVNTPYEGRNDLIGGFFARDTRDGRTFLFHSGRVAGGAPGVSKNALVAWGALKLETVYAGDGSHKEGILVMPTSGPGAVQPAVEYVEAVIAFKAAVRNGRAKAPRPEREWQSVEASDRETTLTSGAETESSDPKVRLFAQVE